MGIGFVLIIWLLFWLVAAVISSVVLGLLTWRLVRGAAKARRIRAILATILLPPAAVISAFVCFVVYGVWCETVRGVDFGIGDGWHVPLGSDYQLVMIDTPEHPFIETPSGNLVGYDFLRIGFDEKVIYLETEPDRFLLVEKSTGDSSTIVTRSELENRLRQLGSPPPTFKSGFDTYSSLRWGLPDLIAIPLVFGIPALLTWWVVAYIRKVRGTVGS